jgi:hypothetical protein
MSKAIYLPSTTPGKTWSVGYYKAPGRNAVWTATEGDLSPVNEFGFQGFSFMMFQARQRRQPILGVATPKRKAEALAALVNALREEGLVAMPEVEAA